MPAKNRSHSLAFLLFLYGRLGPVSEAFTGCEVFSFQRGKESRGGPWLTPVCAMLSVMHIQSKTANPKPKSTKSKNKFPSTWKKALRFDSAPYDFIVACVE